LKHLLAGVNARTLRKAIRNPSRAVSRLVLRARLARRDIVEDRARLGAFLSEHFGVDAAALREEFAQSDFLRWVRSRRKELEHHSGPFRFGTTGEFGCEALYLLVRAACPQIVVDTGVLYGASSGHILAALARNGGGELHSIDLGRDAREPPHDYYVPAELRRHWELITGDSRQELPRLLDRYPVIDMFYHDSLHTFDHMWWEYETALPHLSPAGVLASDDVLNPTSLREIFRLNPFEEFCVRRGIPWITVQDLGVGLPGRLDAHGPPAAGKSATAWR
jgi:predicted O-methyltransferase YrrM